MRSVVLLLLISFNAFATASNPSICKLVLSDASLAKMFSPVTDLSAKQLVRTHGAWERASPYFVHYWNYIHFSPIPKIVGQSSTILLNRPWTNGFKVDGQRVDLWPEGDREALYLMFSGKILETPTLIDERWIEEEVGHWKMQVNGHIVEWRDGSFPNYILKSDLSPEEAERFTANFSESWDGARASKR